MKKILLLILIALFSRAASAHPHVWIDSALTFSKGRIDIVWVFDEMFSNVILSDFDVDGDRQIVGMEMKKVKQGMFDNLVNFDYFMRMYCGNDLLDIDQVRDFRADVENGKVIYSFTLMLRQKQCSKGLEIYNYDDTLYTDIDVKSVKGMGAVLKEDTGGRKYAVIK